MIVLLVVIIVLLIGLSTAVFLLGFRLGGDHWQAELSRVRLEAAHAERRCRRSRKMLRPDHRKCTGVELPRAGWGGW